MKKIPGIRRHGAGWQVRVKVRGESSTQSFPLDAPIREMQEWRKDEAARMRHDHPPVQAGTFPADAQRYLAREPVKALKTYDERCQHIAEWVKAFGNIRRRKITPLLIETQRDRWLTEPRGYDAKGEPLPPYAAGSVNKRLRALSNLWTVLDGRKAMNPVLEVPECEEPDPEARGLPYDVVEAILDALPETGVGVKKDGTRTTGKNVARPSKTKARLRVIAYTGLSHGQLMALDRGDVDLEQGTLRLITRRKGRKVRRAQDRPLPQLLPLIPQAIEAFRELDRLGAWGKFSRSSMWKSFQRACQQLGIDKIRPYDFRHSFLNAMYAETRDLRVTGQFGGHRTERTTKRYTIAAVAPHVAAAADKVAARLGDAGHHAGHRQTDTERK